MRCKPRPPVARMERLNAEQSLQPLRVRRLCLTLRCNTVSCALSWQPLRGLVLSAQKLHWVHISLEVWKCVCQAYWQHCWERIHFALVVCQAVSTKAKGWRNCERIFMIPGIRELKIGTSVTSTSHGDLQAFMFACHEIFLVQKNKSGKNCKN